MKNDAPFRMQTWDPTWRESRGDARGCCAHARHASLFTSLRLGAGVDDIVAFICHQGLLDAVPSST
jgi:hypothetical protein